MSSRKPIKARLIFSKASVAQLEKVFFIPEKVREYHISAVACGGNGGAFNTAARGGGGGGSGAHCDIDVVLKPNTLLRVIYNLVTVGTVTVEYTEYGASNVSEILLFPGVDGGAATGAAAGVGGASGDGQDGGSVATLEGHVPTGVLDGNDHIHNCGGWAGLAGTTFAGYTGMDFGYSHGPNGDIQRYANRWPTPMYNAAGNGGSGGCSYFGGGGFNGYGSVSGLPGFGGGGAGGAFGAIAPQSGGDGFFELSWDEG